MEDIFAMKIRKTVHTIALLVLVVLAGCDPDSIEVELYTSDIKSASSEGVIEVPISVSFSLLGEDEDGDLPNAAEIVKRFLGETTEIKMSEGDFGKVMVVKSKIPMGTNETLETYLNNHTNPLAITIDQSNIELGATSHLAALNLELGNVNMFLDFSLPAKNTIYRIVGDTQEAPEVSAVAVFVDKKAELIFTKKVGKREFIAINFKGGADSVYSQIAPKFSINF